MTIEARPRESQAEQSGQRVTISEDWILITVLKGEKTEIRTFTNDLNGKRRSVKYCNELAQEHLKHPFNRLMDYANKKNDNDAKDFLKQQPFEKPASLSIKTELIDQQTYELLFS